VQSCRGRNDGGYGGGGWRGRQGGGQMFAGVDEADGGCRGGGAEGEELKEGGECGIGGDCEGDCWIWC